MNLYILVLMRYIHVFLFSICYKCIFKNMYIGRDACMSNRVLKMELNEISGT